MKRMYRAVNWKAAIDQVEVVSETKCFITIKGTGGNIKQSRDGFYATWEACKDAEIARNESLVRSREYDLQRARSKLGEWRTLTQPTEVT